MYQKIKRGIQRLRWRLQAAQDALTRSLSPKHSAYQPFMILGAGRTGTNMLVGYLQSHPAIRCYGELFHQYEPRLGYQHLEQPGRLQRLKKQRKKDVSDFLHRHFLGRQPRRLRAIGFKLIYWHAEEKAPWQQQIVPTLQAIENLKVIHIRRTDRLAHYVSGQLAAQNKRWVQRSKNDGSTVKQLDIDPRHFEAFANQIQALEEKYEKLFAQFPCFETTYEALTAEPEQTLAAIQQFLEVPAITMQTDTRKQIQKTKADTILNYDALKAHFQGHAFASFFE